MYPYVRKLRGSPRCFSIYGMMMIIHRMSHKCRKKKFLVPCRICFWLHVRLVASRHCLLVTLLWKRYCYFVWFHFLTFCLAFFPSQVYQNRFAQEVRIFESTKLRDAAVLLADSRSRGRSLLPSPFAPSANVVAMLCYRSHSPPSGCRG